MLGLGVACLVELGEEAEYGACRGRGEGWVVGYLVGHFACLLLGSGWRLVGDVVCLEGVEE